MLFKKPQLMMISLMVVLAAITAVSALQVSPRSSTNGCAGGGSCHGSQYELWVNITSYDIPSSIEAPTSDLVSVTLEITGDGANSYWQCDLSVTASTSNGHVATSSSPQTVNDIRPYYQNTFDFPIEAASSGLDTITITALIDPDHKHVVVSDSVDGQITATVPNIAPVLSSDSVTPPSGTTEGTYSYNVVYTDADDDAPAFVKVHIDDDSAGYSMSLDTDAASTLHDGDRTNGEQYRFETTLAVGSHDFYFSASDGSLTDSTTPKSGPTVSTPMNNVPALSDPNVLPQSGSLEQQFTFNVVYTDADDDAPSYIKLFLDSDTTGIEMSLNTSAQASYRDGLYTNGEQYHFKTTLTEGDHTYSFRCSDGTDTFSTLTLNGLNAFSFPPPVAIISSPENNTENFDDEEVTFDASPSIDNVGSGLSYQWTSNISGALSMETVFRTSLEAGYHRITLSVSDSKMKTDSMWLHINIKERPPLPPSIVNWEPEEPDQSMYEGKELEFNITATGDGTLVYYWFVDNVEATTVTDRLPYVAEAPAVGEHEIEVLVANKYLPTLNDSCSWKVTVLDPTPVVVKVAPSGNQSISVGEIVHLSVEATDPQGGPLEFNWYQNGYPISQGGDLVFNSSSAGTYIIKVVIENADGYSIERIWSIDVIAKSDSSNMNNGTDGGNYDIGGSQGSADEDLGRTESGLIMITTIFVVLAALNLFYVMLKKRQKNKEKSPVVKTSPQTQGPPHNETEYQYPDYPYRFAEQAYGQPYQHSLGQERAGSRYRHRPDHLPDGHIDHGISQGYGEHEADNPGYRPDEPVFEEVEEF